MTYVEWLRVRNVLRIVAVVLGLLIVLSLGMRITFNKYMNDDAIVNHIQKQPGATISHTVLADGTPRTMVHDPSEDTTATIDDVGGGGRHIVIDEPTARAKDNVEHVTIGSVEVHTEKQGDRTITVVDTNSSVPFLYYMIFADAIAFMVATFLAAPFARENDGHLEIALTRPVSRSILGISMIAVDMAGIVLASVMTIVALVICQAMFESPHFTFDGINTQSIAMGIAFPFAWYAMLAACTASMRRGYGAVLGFAWPAAIVIVVLGLVPLGDSLIGQAIHAAFWTISRVIPLSYFDSHITFNSSGALQGSAGHFGIRLAIEWGLFLIYSALAVVQWKRVEA